MPTMPRRIKKRQFNFFRVRAGIPHYVRSGTKKVVNILIDSIEIFPTKRAYGYLKTIHFSFPILNGDEIKQTMTIWDEYPDILDEDGNFNGNNPEDDLPPAELESNTLEVHEEAPSFPPNRITDESVALISKE